jgi:hypothetical protein
MTIKQQGGVFGRNPTFNDVDVEGTLTVTGASSTAALSATTGTFSTVYASTSVAVGAAANYQATFYKAGANANYVQVSNGMLGAGAGNGILYGVDASGNGVLNKQGTGDLITTVAGIERLRILQAGTFDVSAANIAFDSGYGIDFSATAGTGTSELFDDYEEGTWTPSYTPTTGSFTTMTYNNQEGYYTKVGDLVYINCLISTNNSNPSGGSGDLLISGLPYTCGASADHSLAISGVVNWGGDYPLAGLVTESSSTIKFQYRTAINGATSSLDVSDMATSTSSNRNYIRFSGCYKV